ncbi:hypothetical protein [Desulfosporosinus fructosivorans]
MRWYEVSQDVLEHVDIKLKNPSGFTLQVSVGNILLLLDKVRSADN